jgi:hypothetical protein
MVLTNVDPSYISQFDPAVLAQARTEIEYLRRWYAVATDALGKADEPESIAQGKRIYHRIFTTNADIGVVGGSGKPLQASGPDGWAAVAMNALKDYQATQHLIGTQVVDMLELTTDNNSNVPTSGRALLNSYLQAWHAWPDQRLRLVIGTYTDLVIYTPGTGWQIEKMTLTYTSGEERQLGS